MAIYDVMPKIPEGFTVAEVKQWRADQQNAGRPSGVDDFLSAHGYCINCLGHGRLIIRVSWRDSEGNDCYYDSPISDPPVELRSIPKGPWEPITNWECRYAACPVCGGSGRT